MIKRIKQYERYRDYYSLNCFEVQAALLCMIVISWLCIINLDLYECFTKYQNDLKQIISAVVGGEFSLLGMSLAGMAIVTSIFAPKTLKIISSFDYNNNIDIVLSQFEFFALNLAIQMVYLIVIYLTIISDKPLLNKGYFVIIFVVVIYHFCFNIFYIISLIENCIKINAIKNIGDRIDMIKKSNIDIANEVRIDYILAMLLKEKNIGKKILLNDLYKIIDEMNIPNKQDIKEYLSNYYGK